MKDRVKYSTSWREGDGRYTVFLKVQDGADADAPFSSPAVARAEKWEKVEALASGMPASGWFSLDISRDGEYRDGPGGIPAQRDFLNGRLWYQAHIIEGKLADGADGEPARIWFDSEGRVSRAQRFRDGEMVHALDVIEMAELDEWLARKRERLQALSALKEEFSETASAVAVRDLPSPAPAAVPPAVRLKGKAHGL